MFNSRLGSSVIAGATSISKPQASESLVAATTTSRLSTGLHQVLGWYQVSYTIPQHYFSLLSANVPTVCFLYRLPGTTITLVVVYNHHKNWLPPGKFIFYFVFFDQY